MMVMTNNIVVMTPLAGAEFEAGASASKRDSVPEGQRCLMVRPFNGWTGRLVKPDGEKTELSSHVSGFVYPKMKSMISLNSIIERLIGVSTTFQLTISEHGGVVRLPE